MKNLKLKTLVIIAFACFYSCSDDNLCITGNGLIRTQEIAIADFTGIKTYGNDHVIISQGTSQKVEVTGHSNIINKLKTVVRNGVWEIELENNCYKNADLTINITIPNLHAISLIGSGDVLVNDFINQENLSIDLIGSGNIELNENEGTENLVITIEGSGFIKGNADFLDLKKLDIDIIGSCDYEGFPIITDECNIRIEGSGNCDIFVRNKLDVTIVASGNVRYKGNPEITVSITGSGELQDAN